jgi:ribose 5-phosphate isomerase A
VVDPEGRVLKSRGGGLAMDRLLWRTAQRMYLAVDSSQFVGALGRKLPLPVEVHRDAVIPVARELTRLGAGDVQLRLSAGKDGPVITESGNLLLDARFSSLAPGLAAAITALPGAIETGLFEGCGFETLS